VIVNSGPSQPGEPVRVYFAGARTRVGPMTVGQVNMRRCVLRDDPAHMNACVIRKLPAGMGLDRIADAVRTLALRHEALRTVYPELPYLRQEVAGDGWFTLAVHPAPGDPLEHARAVGKQIQAVRFDPQAELPMRLAVVTVDGVPDHLVLVLCHIAVDAAALDLIGREWDELTAGRPLPPPGPLQPVDLALDEQGPAGQRRLASSLRYWETVLRGTPQSMFAIPGIDRTDWMHPRLRIRSKAAAAALPAIAERTGASPPNIVLAALCALLCRRLDQSTFVVATPAANRVQTELADYVGTVAQDALASIPLEGAETFDELIRRARSRSFTALRHSRFDYEELLPVIGRVERERGSHWARDCVFNDLTGLTLEGLLAPTPVPPTTVPPTPVPGSPDPRLDWFRPESMLTRLMLWAIRLEGEVELALWADPQCLPPDQAEELGAGITRLIVAAAQEDLDLSRLDAISGLTRVVRGEGWCRIDSCWIDLASVRALLEDVLPDRPHHLALAPDEHLGRRLECLLAADPDGAVPDIEAIHAACLDGLRHRRLAAMAPHRYLVVDRAPHDPRDAAAWRRRPVRVEDDGRGRPAPVAAAAR
jgi:Condensation domain